MSIKIVILVAMLAMTGQATAGSIHKLPPDCGSEDIYRRKNCVEVEIKFITGKPDQREFKLAAKRALFKRNYEISSVEDYKVTGIYKRRVTMDLILTDSAVIVRYIDSGRSKPDRVIGYLRNLHRDIIYELAAYFL